MTIVPGIAMRELLEVATAIFGAVAPLGITGCASERLW
jgi:hypothetical protein